MGALTHNKFARFCYVNVTQRPLTHPGDFATVAPDVTVAKRADSGKGARSNFGQNLIKRSFHEDNYARIVWQR